jgi:hypothetical protein
LPKSANQVLAFIQVNPSFSAYCCVDLTEQRRGNVDHSYAPVVDRCGEASDISDYSTSDADN